MHGWVKAIVDGEETHRRKFRNDYEKEKFTIKLKKQAPGCEIEVDEDDSVKYIYKRKKIVQEKIAINWFGSMTGDLADFLTKRKFGIEARKTTHEQRIALWGQFGRPRYFIRKNILNYIHHASF